MKWKDTLHEYYQQEIESLPCDSNPTELIQRAASRPTVKTPVIFSLINVLVYSCVTVLLTVFILDIGVKSPLRKTTQKAYIENDVETKTEEGFHNFMKYWSKTKGGNL